MCAVFGVWLFDLCVAGWWATATIWLFLGYFLYLHWIGGVWFG